MSEGRGILYEYLLCSLVNLLVDNSVPRTSTELGQCQNL